jgi:hypothetical protein
MSWPTADYSEANSLLSFLDDEFNNRRVDESYVAGTEQTI